MDAMRRIAKHMLFILCIYTRYIYIYPYTNMESQLGLYIYLYIYIWQRKN